MNPETKLMNQIQVRAAQLGFRLFRNTVGLAWLGTPIPINNTPHVLLHNARRVRVGFTPGSSDLIGWRPVIVTQDMVGTVIAQFVAREVKTPNGRPTPGQIDFVNTVNDAGGDAMIITSPEHLE